MNVRSVHIVDQGQGLGVSFEDGSRAVFHCVWLRENSPDPATVDGTSGQKRIAIGDIPPTLRITGANRSHAAQVAIRFSDRPEYCVFESTWLADQARRVRTDIDVHNLLPSHVEVFDASFDPAQVLFEYDAVLRSSAQEARWLRCVRRFGFARLEGVPCEPGTVARVARRFGHVRVTNYGEIFDVRSEENPINLAYTRRALQLHTDNPYRDPVPTLQLLHCLAGDSAGGDSVVADGFAAAVSLRAVSSQCFEELCRQPVEFRFESADSSLRARKPMIELDAGGQVCAIRFNNRSLAPLDLPYERMERFYRAYRQLADLLERAQAQVVFRMGPGELFMVDNRRVLHGRRAFSAQGFRHLQGCYADVDALESRIRVLTRPGQVG